MIFAGSQTRNESRHAQEKIKSTYHRRPFLRSGGQSAPFVSVLKRRTNSPTMQVRANSLTMRSIVPHVRRTRDWSPPSARQVARIRISRDLTSRSPLARPRQAIGSTMNVTASAPPSAVRSAARPPRLRFPPRCVRANPYRDPRPRCRGRRGPPTKPSSETSNRRTRAIARRRAAPRPPRSPADLSLTPFDALFR